MADSRDFPDSYPTGEDTPRADLRSYPGTPRWMKVLGIIAIVLVLLVGFMMLTGGGDHGPGRHIPSGEPPPASVTEGFLPPAGVPDYSVPQP